MNNDTPKITETDPRRSATIKADGEGARSESARRPAPVVDAAVVRRVRDLLEQHHPEQLPVMDHAIMEATRAQLAGHVALWIAVQTSLIYAAPKKYGQFEAKFTSSSSPSGYDLMVSMFGRHRNLLIVLILRGLRKRGEISASDFRTLEAG